MTRLLTDEVTYLASCLMEMSVTRKLQLQPRCSTLINLCTLLFELDIGKLLLVRERTFSYHS
ncbi:hypothetical protein T10_13339 [Trichinella papuae]|uniref:Uncharacterized protein n=1 Tax=Trichinella papuae TaxID=268474 RepID=A0A0V1MBZ6_9BILA|nr:hypothetical protein T10_13339 [Trichinella papuae]